MLFWFPETRSTIVLEKIAKSLQKRTGDKRYKARVESRILATHLDKL